MVASAVVLGLRILNLLRLRAHFTQGEAIGLAGGLGLAALSLATLGLGLASLYEAPVLVALVIAPLLLFGPERQGLIDVTRATFAGWGRYRNWRGLASFDSIASVASAGIVTLALFFTLIRDLTMPSLHTGYDTYQYHWAVPALLLQSHDMRAFPGWAHANLPFGTEMLSLIALSLQAPYAALLVLDTFLLLGALTLFALVRRHFGATAAWFAVASLVTVPLLAVFTSQA
ncbi:MAG TPA: hypothetical protein VGR57_14135, partial [Ktedonobacterales bacterium]|nr:hypothetical protein [Ktedonobacterales bacterium]